MHMLLALVSRCLQLSGRQCLHGTAPRLRTVANYLVSPCSPSVALCPSSLCTLISSQFGENTQQKAPRRNASPTTWDRLPATLLEAMYIYQMLKQYIYIKSQSNIHIQPRHCTFLASLKSNFVFDNGLNTLSDLCPPPYTPSVPAVHSPA